MKHLLEVIEDNGFKPYRFKYGFKECKTPSDISATVSGGLAVYWVKDEDFSNPVIWGLSEKGKPPTLISPRPKAFIIFRQRTSHDG